MTDFLLYGDLRLQIQNAYPDAFCDRHFLGMRQRILVVASFADRAEDVQRPEARHEKLMSGRGEIRLARAKAFPGMSPIGGAQVLQNGEQARNVCRLHGMHDVLIERA